MVIIDGCPAGLALTEEDFETDMARRRPGQSRLVSQRKESDAVRILSGVFEGATTGTSLALFVENTDARSKDYDAIRNVYRPGHADQTYQVKYGRRDHRGGGRASARETTARVAAGVVAKRLMAEAFGGQVVGYVQQVGHVVARIDAPENLTVEQVEANEVRCPDPQAAAEMIAVIEAARKDQDSIGGIAELVATGVPAGLGEPVFDKLKADLGRALFSLPAVLGVEYGVGFGCATLKGSENNDPFTTDESGRILTISNRHGGMLGGISSGMPIILRAAIKPTSSLSKPQPTVTVDGTPTTVRTLGRHDPCLLPRFIPMGEAMVALVLADHWLRHRGQDRWRD